MVPVEAGRSSIQIKSITLISFTKVLGVGKPSAACCELIVWPKVVNLSATYKRKWEVKRHAVCASYQFINASCSVPNRTEHFIPSNPLTHNPHTLLTICVLFNKSVYFYRYLCENMTEKADSLATESSMDLAWTKLLDNQQQSSAPDSVTIKMESTPHDSLSTTTDTPQLKKSASWLGSFHKQLQKSMKAVADSPGPMISR